MRLLFIFDVKITSVTLQILINFACGLHHADKFLKLELSCLGEGVENASHLLPINGCVICTFGIVLEGKSINT